MISERSFVIDSSLSGKTLAAVLRQVSGTLTWTQARSLIASRRVQVNGSVCLDDARRLKERDAIEILGEISTSVPAEPDLRIVYSDADLIVIEKPAGVQTVRRIEERNWSDERKQRQPVVLEMVQRMIATAHPHLGKSRRGADKKLSRPRPKTAPQPELRVRPVHRLDRDTSGLMLFALSGPAEAELVRRFANHQVRRVYWALILGHLPAAKTIESWILRDRGDGTRGSVPGGKSSPLGQRAVTHVRPIEHIGNVFTVVECRLETGRTHQIRIHMAELGHPLCGEKLYLRSQPDGPITEDHSGAPRQALHSAELEFEHPTTKKAMRFESTWPADLARWIELRKASTSRASA